MNIINKIAKRIVSSEIPLDESIYKLKNKISIKSRIYKLILPYTEGFFHDDGWQNVHTVFNKMKELGIDINWYVKDGGYFYDRDDKSIKGKRYNFDFSITNFEDKTFDFQGELNCYFCGTINDPMSSYDMVFSIY